ncbi:MAG TPA: methyltransferase domain-containing protein [Polyangiaceae bacterium]|nr:methyltransferase domain-containing protein [Polyangiaceae bacterium]
MQTGDTKFAGSIPDIYDRYLVPLLFQPYADDLAQRLLALRHGTLVEVAAGTGAVTHTLRHTLSSDVRILATDLNEGMLRVNSQRVSDPSVSFQRADAQQLPFEDGSANAVVCQFGMMFVPDKVAAYREARRVLAPGGRLLFNVWDSLTHNEVSQMVMRAVASLFPNDPPAFFDRIPFAFFDAARLRADLKGAGFEQIEIETVAKVSQAPSAEHVAIGMCQGTPLRSEIEARDPQTGLARATAAATAALQAHFGAGPFENRMSAVVVTALR